MQDHHQIRLDMCEIGRRIYERQFVAATDGNITVRVGENEVLCTPTMHCKGFLKPDDIAVVDMTGKQLSGAKQRSSEALLHLEVYRQREDIRSVVHCHPPHATAFAVAREAIPQSVLPEVEFFLGEVPITKYETPGGQAFADTILPFVRKTDVIILANHGTVSYAQGVEQAYWKTEILDSYCRILLLAKQLGNIAYLDESKTRELLALKAKAGMQDARNLEVNKYCDVREHAIFGETWADADVSQRAFSSIASSEKNLPQATSSDAVELDERLVSLITKEVIKQWEARQEPS